ncbi:hypothetical protein, partial [Tropheryma whipplei]|uniref:hypothetical protein n=1 Tax=Tropheryma whipplei TaxID=2039 RepID=UPI0019D38823
MLALIALLNPPNNHTWFNPREPCSHHAGDTTGNTNGKKRVKRGAPTTPPEHPLKSVNEQINTDQVNPEKIKTAH